MKLNPKKYAVIRIPITKKGPITLQQTNKTKEEITQQKTANRNRIADYVEIAILQEDIQLQKLIKR